MQLKTYTKTGKLSSSKLSVDKNIFGVEINQPLLSQAIRVYLSNQRQGTSKVKTRSAVKRTKSKWYRQKGTGNARHGSKNAPIFVGGGVAHGPTGKENWKLKLTKSLKTQAFINALSAQAANFMVCDEIENLSGKTKEAAILINNLVGSKDKVLVILSEAKPEVLRSLRNLENVLITKVQRINIYEISLADKIILSSAAVKALEEKFTGSKNAKKVADKK